MIPGLPNLPNSQLLPMLHQAWLSRAATMTHNSFIQTSPFGVPPAFHFNPFMVAPPTSSPELPDKRSIEAEDLSFNKRMRAEIICPICSIAVRREDLVEHFETELKCLDNIRTLSPITRPSSRTSQRPYSVSPNKSSSLSPSSPGYLENRWERFERIRSKRRERIGVKSIRRQQQLQRQDIHDEDIDIGDSLSDCGSASETESNQTFGPTQYTEADVLRELSEPEVNQNEGRGVEGGMRCPGCSSSMVTPVLNIACWHLKCEKCWLRAVGTSKCCALCASPASVKELRKVHV